jgi:serine/threonine protein phosphatase 1
MGPETKADTKFARLLGQGRVWAVASPMGEAERLAVLHHHLAHRLQYPDQVVYLGNYLGPGPQVCQTLDEILSFRRWLLARPLMFLEDHAYLRGAQEEMWSKLLQLHFAPNPREVLGWVLDHGAAGALEAYGGSAQDGLIAAREGPVALARWTSHLRAMMAARAGHQPFLTHLRRAAVSRDRHLLFVNSGIEPDRPLYDQKDAFWWASSKFTRMTAPFEGFARVVRGFDPAAAGLVETAVSLSLDAGCGRGGGLMAVCLAPDGTLLDHLLV